ncbi:MAG TPA: O-antigen ligase family protein [Burkholderiaceae bacterium]|nr:O-antigen ligase family protein [Burkholderiaceae bacterium]
MLLAAVGCFTSPPVTNIGAALGLIVLFFIPGAWIALRATAAGPMGRSVLALLAVMALAMLWSDAPLARRFGEWWSWRPLLLLIVLAPLFSAQQTKDRFAVALVGVLAVCAAASFLVLLLPNPVFIDQPGVILRNHTTQGMAFVVGSVLAATLAWGRPVSAQLRLFLVGALALFVGNLALVTTGRSAHVAILVAGAACAFSLATARWRWWAAAGALLLGVAILFSSSMVRDRFAKAYEEIGTANTVTTETAIGSRIVIWNITRDLIARHPLLGYGMGSFPTAYSQELQNRHDLAWRAQVDDPQNEYLRVMVDAGIPGILAFAAFVFATLRQQAQAPYRGAGRALLLAWLCTSVFNSHFQTFAEAHLLCLVLGVLLASESAAQRSSSCVATAAATSS